MKMKTIVYKIECEWDMGFGDTVYSTKELARESIDSVSWEDVDYESSEQVMEAGYVAIVGVTLVTNESSE